MVVPIDKDYVASEARAGNKTNQQQIKKNTHTLTPPITPVVTTRYITLVAKALRNIPSEAKAAPISTVMRGPTLLVIYLEGGGGGR